MKDWVCTCSCPNKLDYRIFKLGGIVLTGCSKCLMIVLKAVMDIKGENSR